MDYELESRFCLRFRDGRLFIFLPEQSEVIGRREREYSSDLGKEGNARERCRRMKRSYFVIDDRVAVIGVDIQPFSAFRRLDTQDLDRTERG